MIYEYVSVGEKVKESSSTIFKDIIFLKTVDSTSSYCKRILQKHHPREGTAIIAEWQTGGRGQFDTKWESGNGENLLMSVILYPIFLTADELFILSQAMSVACVDSLRSLFGHSVEIKWPNDIVYNRKKIGGILIENSLLGQGISYSIIGIGLNVNQTDFKNLSAKATSIRLITGRMVDLVRLRDHVLQNIQKWYVRTDSNQEAIKKQYWEWLAGTKKFFPYLESVTKHSATGIIRQVLTDGSIIMANNLGQEKKYGWKEIEWYYLHN